MLHVLRCGVVPYCTMWYHIVMYCIIYSYPTDPRYSTTNIKLFGAISYRTIWYLTLLCGNVSYCTVLYIHIQPNNMVSNTDELYLLYGVI